MTTFNFTATIHQEGQTPIVELQGDINGFSEADLNAAYTQAEQLSGDSIVLDFRKVDYINSTGIALIVGLLARARALHKSIIASGLSDHYREIFTITRLSDFMEIR